MDRLGDLVNNFRVKTLGLEPVSTLWAPGQLYRLKVPYTYLWSPGLVPKPKDWGPEIDIAGFVFLDLASSFEPPIELSRFLDAGDPPVYIGFGSIVVDDPDKFTKMIFEAVKKAGVRHLHSYQKDGEVLVMTMFRRIFTCLRIRLTIGCFRKCMLSCLGLYVDNQC